MGLAHKDKGRVLGRGQGVTGLVLDYAVSRIQALVTHRAVARSNF